MRKQATQTRPACVPCPVLAGANGAMGASVSGGECAHAHTSQPFLWSTGQEDVAQWWAVAHRLGTPALGETQHQLHFNKCLIYSHHSESSDKHHDLTLFLAASLFP